MIFGSFLRLWSFGGKLTFFPSFIIQMWLHFMVWYSMDQVVQWPLWQNIWWMVLLGMYYFARIGNAFENRFCISVILDKTMAYYFLKFVEKRAVLLQLISWIECMNIYWEKFMIWYNCMIANQIYQSLSIQQEHLSVKLYVQSFCF